MLGRAATALALLGLAGCLHASSGGARPDWKAEVLTAEARRDAFAPAIRAALASPEPELRRAGLWALARIEEVGTSTLAAPRLLDSDPEVAAAAAFALGQIGDAHAQATLRQGLAGTAAKPAALRALARCGTASVAEDLAARLDAPSATVRAAAALSLGLLKKRLPKAVAPSYAIRLVPLVTAPEPEVRFGATYALARFVGPEAAVGLVAALTDTDPEVRMWAAIGLGRSGANPSVLDAVMRDPDWRVRAAAAAALGRMAAASPTEAGRAVSRIDALASQSFARVSKGDRLAGGRAMHVLGAAIAAAEQAGRPGRRVLEKLEQATWETENLPPSASRDLARVQCAAAVALDRLDGAAQRVKTCGKGTFSEARRQQLWMRLLARARRIDAVAEISAFARNPDPSLRTSAVLALGDVVSAQSTEVLLGLLDSNDPAVVSGAIEILARPDRAGLRPPALAERLFDAVERLRQQPDDSLVVGPIDALGNLGEDARPLLGRARAWLDDPRPAVRRRAAKLQERLTGVPTPFGRTRGGPLVKRPLPWPRSVELVLETERGALVLGLDGGKAPRFTGTVRALAQAGFYDGLSFHRVVSTFVTQGGCPRGDGWGGPGYTVAGETSPAPFVRGAIGVATNGRDTGGSQLFLMHAYHPHLDGQYSWIGRVLEGIDVMDALQEDDRILRAYLR